MSDQLSDFAIKLVDTLEDNLDASGKMRDPISKTLTPPDQYAETCFAAAAFRAHAATEEDHYKRSGKKALKSYLQRTDKKKGHKEFNSFALLEILRDLRNNKYSLPFSKRELAKNISYQSSLSSHQGNNWLLLKVLCKRLNEDLSTSSSYNMYGRLLSMTSASWMTDDGLLIDNPRHPVFSYETPLTYHAKMTMCHTRLALLGVSKSKKYLLSALRTLYEICLDSGECFFFGRSENTLFGYACALDAVLCVFNGLNCDDVEWLIELRDRLSSYVISNYNPEIGLVFPERMDSKDPSVPESKNRSIDDYIYNAVYAAYTSMLLLDDHQLSGVTCSDNRELKWTDTVDNFSTVSQIQGMIGDNSELGIATRGQMKRTKNLPDPRYSGLIPLTFNCGGKNICPGIPAEFSKYIQMPYLPVLTHGNKHVTPHIWETEVRRSSWGYIFIGRGIFQDVPQSSLYHDESKKNNKFESILRKNDTVRKFVNLTYRKSRMNLLFEEIDKRQEKFPAEVHRIFTYNMENDFIVLSTLTFPKKELTIYPTSHVVASDHTKVIRQASHDLSLETQDCKTHKGDSFWSLVAPLQLESGEDFETTIAIDPKEQIQSVESNIRARHSFSLDVNVISGNDISERIALNQVVDEQCSD